MVPGENKQIVVVPHMWVSATSAEDEPRALCIIRDMSSGRSGDQRVVLNLPASTSASQLMSDVAERLHYEKDSFQLVLPRFREKDLIEVHLHEKETLEDLGFRFGNHERNNLIVENKNSMSPRKIDVPEENAEGGEWGGGEKESFVPPPAPPPYTSEFSFSYNNTATARQEAGFVGLVNQAMTCYLNSLLQTLFMTPEFRNTLYRWEFDGTEEDGTKSIPFQLQKLFLQLQTSPKPAVGTTDLTTSFGWDSSEAWQQHDVQELCRVMFDALEQKFKNTQQADLISRLYEGRLKDYVKCQECGNESAREDTFLDVPLVVRPFGSSQAYTSVNEALRAFVSPETLDGSNQYHCSVCDKKCDAHKGLKFVRFPYLLTLQMKRFDFDPNTMHRIKLNDRRHSPMRNKPQSSYVPNNLNGLEFVRFSYLLTLQMKRFNFDPNTMHCIKLNDRVSFPEVLTLNDFIISEKDEEAGVASGGGDEASAQTTTVDVATETDEVLGEEVATVGEEDEGIDVEPREEAPLSEEGIRKALQKGPYVYELFSIMVHSGSANGGHYYAYIKSFKTKEWYCFNDAQVTKITQEDIQKTYGGGPARGYYSSAYSSSTNAYMLMYRQIDKKKNAEFLSLEQMPEHTQALLQCMVEQEERERILKEMDKAMCKIKLFCQHPTQQRLIEMKLKVHKDCTLQQATQTAHTILGLDGVVDLDLCRLVKYDEFSDSLEQSWGGREGERIGDVLGGARGSYKFELLLETKRRGEEWQEYRPGGTTVKVHVVNLEEEVSIHPTTIRCHPSNTVEELYNQIAQALCISGRRLRVVLETYNSEYKLLQVPHNTLFSEGFRKSNKVFVEWKDASDADLPYEDSRLWHVMDCYAHTICVHISLPKVDKVSLDRLRIYDDVSDEGKYELSSDEEENTDGVVKGASPRGDHDFDEGLGDSETGDPHPPTHSDPSTDSSLTDSERTLVGDDLSPRNNSPAGSEDPSPSSDGDGGARPECDPSSSPEEDGGTSAPPLSAPVARFFRAWPYTDYETAEKMLRVYVDKRTTLAELKKELESHVGIRADSFKLYRVYSNNQEFECTRLSDNLMSYGEDSRLTVKLGRALRKGEYKVRIYKLTLNDPEPVKFLLEWVVVRGMTVLKAKKEILPQIKEQCGLDIPLNRCRLRKKCWKNPSQVFFDPQRFDKDIPVNTNWEMFLQVLTDAEPLSCSRQLTCFVRRWHPPSLLLDPLTEVVLEDSSIQHLQHKLHEISDIPEEFIEFAKGEGTFPCEMSLLSVHRDLDWTSVTLFKGLSNLCWVDDGHVIYYRDKREELKKLSDEEIREISNKENARSTRGLKNYSSPRKERALKIYTMDPPPSKAVAVVPDLDW